MAEVKYDERGGIVELGTEGQPARAAKRGRKRKGYTRTEKLLIGRSKKLNYLLGENSQYKCRTEETPFILRIGPTNRCSGRCSYCPRELVHQWGTGYMDFGLYKNIIKWAAKNGVKTISFGLWGEPLLHPRFLEMVDLAHKAGLGLVLSTNAILMSKEKADKILEYPFEVIEVSMDGFTREEYLKSKQVDMFDRAKANLLYLLSAAKKKGSKASFNVHFVDVGHVSFANRVRYIRFWKKQLAGLKYATTFCYEPHNWAGTVDAKKNMRLFDRVLMSWEIRKPCVYIKGISINWDGTMFACANNPLKEAALGNVKEMTPKEAYNCAKRMEYLTENERGTFNSPGCANCTVNSAHPLMYAKKRVINRLISAVS